MTSFLLNATQCLLMAKVADRMPGMDRSLFWKILPDMMPDLTTHLPALAAAVSRETEWDVLEVLASHPLPTALSPEGAGWRQELATAWENQLNTAREALNQQKTDWGRRRRYISTLSGLTEMDRCGNPQGTTCPSVLPTLLNEARHVLKHLREMIAARDLQKHDQFECLGILAGWHPAPNVGTDSAILKAWGNFWLELYHEDKDVTSGEAEAALIKGIAAKGLLNLIESAGRKETGVPDGMEPLLLESLTRAVESAGENPENSDHLAHLSWQPQHVSRFPADKLAKLPAIWLKTVKLLCQMPDRWEVGIQQAALYGTLAELLRWNASGWLAACRINLFSCIVPDVSDYLNHRLGRHVTDTDEAFPNYRLYEWFVGLVRHEVAYVEGGKELLQKLENHWQAECKLVHAPWAETLRVVAWKGRIQLQRTGLATEMPDAFHKDLLETISTEQNPMVRLALSLWRPGKHTPAKVKREWTGLWGEGLKSANEVMATVSTLALLRPDPTDTLVAQRQKLKDILQMLPKERLPKLSLTELAGLMEIPGGLPLDRAGMGDNQSWNFSSNGVKFRLPTESTALVSKTATSQATHSGTRPDRTRQRTVGNDPTSGGHYR